MARELVPELVRKTEAEVTYIRERQRVNRERFRAYRDDFRQARDQWDYRRMAEAVQDVTAIMADTVRLGERRMRVQDRLSRLRTNARFAQAEEGEGAGVSVVSLHDRADC